MGRRNKNHKGAKAECVAAARSAGAHEPPHSSRAEILQQVEALVAHAMNHVMRIGYGDELSWPGRVARSDGFQVRIAEMAIDLATERLSAACEQIAQEIASELGAPPKEPRTRYRILPRTSRDEPEPPAYFLPPQATEPPKPPGSSCRRRKVQPSAGGDGTASRDHVAMGDEAPSQQHPSEELH